MKKFYPITLASALILASVTSVCADTFVLDGLRYNVWNGNEATVDKYLSGTDIVIPDSVIDPSSGDTLAVTAITRQAFYQASIRSVSIPTTMRVIDRYAFWKSTVQTVVMADGVTDLGYGVFNECSALSSINIPSTVTALGFMSSLTGLSGSVFYGCSSLEEITVPGSVDSIPNQTFRACTGLKKVVFEEGIHSLGERVFEGCGDLTDISYPSTLDTIGRGTFQYSDISQATFPGNVAVLPNSCFVGCHNLRSFVIEEGVKEIGRQAFADCYALTEVRVPNSVEWIHADAFQGNGYVAKIYLGYNVKRIGHSALAVWEPDIDTNTPHWAVTDIYVNAEIPPVFEPNDEHFNELEADFFFGAEEFTSDLREEFFTSVKLHVPVSAEAAYHQAEIWENFANIIPDQAGLESVHALDHSQGCEIYTLNGIKVNSSVGALKSGIYIVRRGADTRKLIVK